MFCIARLRRERVEQNILSEVPHSEVHLIKDYLFFIARTCRCIKVMINNLPLGLGFILKNIIPCMVIQPKDKS